MRLFDPKNANNMFDNLETQAYLAPKNVFKWPIVCQSNEILDLWPIATQKDKKMSIFFKVFCPVAFFMHHPLSFVVFWKVMRLGKNFLSQTKDVGTRTLKMAYNWK